LVAILSCQKIWDLDIWMHLQTGRYILTHFRIPQGDIYSYTSTGHFWFNPDWLFAVVAYLFYNVFGINGLIVLKLIIFLTIYALLFYLSLKKVNWTASLVLLFFTVLVAKERIVERPEMFSVLFTVIYLSILFNFRSIPVLATTAPEGKGISAARMRHSKLIWLLPALQVFWINLHTLAPLGIIFVWVFIIAEFINLKIDLPWEWNRSVNPDYHRLKVLLAVGVAIILATFINPYGLRIVKEYVSIFRWLHSHIDVLAGGITELRPPFVERKLFDLEFIYYKILIVVSQVSFLINYRRINLSNLFLYFIFLYLSLTAIRNIAFFGIVSMPIVADNLASILSQKKFSFRNRKTRLLGNVFILLLYSGTVFGCLYFSHDVMSSYFVMDGRLQSRAGLGESPLHPRAAIDFLLENKIQGNGFHNFNFGGYFIWRAWPRLKVFIDGRTSVYDEDHLRYYSNVFLYPYMFEQLVDDFNINYFLLDINTGRVLLKRLYDDPNWRLVFFDDNGLIFLRNTDENREIIEEFALDFKHWQEEPSDIKVQKISKRRKVYPLSYFKKGVFFETIGNIELARYEYEKALKINPYIGEIYNNIGVLYQIEGKFDEAITYYKKAVSVNPRLPSAHANLGFLYEKKGMKDEAIEEYRKATYRGILSAEAHNNIGCIYFEKGLYRKALTEFKKAIAINYGRTDYHFNLGALYQAMGLIDAAISSYKEAIRMEPENIGAHNNLGACYLAKGDLLKARRICEKILEIDPDNEMARNNLEGILQKIDEHPRPPK
jgi:tetratricopeptide (TPR) repeat protein